MTAPGISVQLAQTRESSKTESVSAVGSLQWQISSQTLIDKTVKNVRRNDKTYSDYHAKRSDNRTV